MKLVLLYGNGFSAMSQKLSSIRKNFNSVSVIEVNDSDASGTELAGIFGQQLFTEKRLVILDNYNGKLDFDKVDDDGLTVVVTVKKALSPTSELLIKARKFGAQVYFFSEKGETPIFPFLDLLAEKNKKALYQLESYLDEWGGQYALTMIFYMFRRQILPLRNTFEARKIESQKKNFSTDDICRLYKEGLETDFNIKSGNIDEKLGITLFIQKILAFTPIDS